METPADIRYRRAVKTLTRFVRNNLYLLMASLATILFVVSAFSPSTLIYSDADGYMRAIRVYHWLLNPSFTEQMISESNYPFGEIIHWTRPMDILWLINTLPFFMLLDNLKDIITVSGWMVAPWLGVLSVIVLAYGLQRLFNVWLTLFGCFIFLLMTPYTSYFSPLRPDHHALVILLALYGQALIFCWLKKRRERYLRLLGLTLALAVWTACEGIILYILFTAFFIWLYLFKNLSLRPALKITFWFALGCTIAWLLNPPYQGWFYPDNGRISVIYVSFAWLTYIALYVIDRFHLHTPRLKLVSLALAATSVAVLLPALFGVNIYHFQLDQELNGIWAKYIYEMQPFYNFSVQRNLSWFTFSICAVTLSFWLLRYKQYRRLMACNLIIGLPLLGINLWAERFSYYQILYTILPYLCLVDYFYKKSPYAKDMTNKFPISVWLTMLGILLLQQIVQIPYSLRLEKQVGKATVSSQLYHQIQQIGGVLLTDTFRTPQFVWQCGVNTVATPYHRNRQGIIDAHNILFSENDNQIIPLLLKHQVTQILLFENYNNQHYNMQKENQNKLYYRLLKKENIPAFLEEIPTVLEQTHLYRIKI